MSSPRLIRLIELPQFTAWLRKLRDRVAQRAIERRLRRLIDGNFGDARSVGDGISELRIDVGPGYRAYFLRRGDAIIVMLCGGDKSTQARDIALAKMLIPAAEEILNADRR